MYQPGSRSLRGQNESRKSSPYPYPDLTLHSGSQRDMRAREDTSIPSKDVDPFAAPPAFPGLRPFHVVDPVSENAAAWIAGQNINDGCDDGCGVIATDTSPLNTTEFNIGRHDWSSDGVGRIQVQPDTPYFIPPPHDVNLDVMPSMTGSNFPWVCSSQNGARHGGGGDIEPYLSSSLSYPYLVDSMAFNGNDGYTPSPQMAGRAFNEFPVNQPSVCGTSHFGNSNGDELQDGRNIPLPYPEDYYHPGSESTGASIAGQSENYGSLANATVPPVNNISDFHVSGVPRAFGRRDGMQGVASPMFQSQALDPSMISNEQRDEGGDTTSRLSLPDKRQPRVGRQVKAIDPFCNDCNVQFSRQSDLNRHYRENKKHGGPKHRCTGCKQKFSREQTLNNHRLKSCKGRRGQ